MAEMVSENFKSGDLVWAKMKSYPAWPAKIVEPPSDTKAPKQKKSHFVEFFGSDNYAWIEDKNIVHHSESVLNASSKKKSASLQKAIDALLSCSRKEKLPEIKREKISNVDTVTKRQNKKSNKKKSSKDMNGERNITSRPCKVPKLNSAGEEEDYPSSYATFTDGEVEKNFLIPSSNKFGFIGLGHMGCHIVNNLLLSGHNVTVWNRTSSKCEKFVGMGAKRASSAADLVVECDVTFSCVSDPESSNALLFGDKGVLQGLQTAKRLGLGQKGYVEMTSIDPESSLQIKEVITTTGGMYLEAPLCGTRVNAEYGTLLILASGDRKLFAECETCFHAIATHAFYLTCEVGYAAKVALMLSMLSGNVCAITAEALVLVERLKIDKKLFLTAMRHGPLDCEAASEKFHLMSDRNYKTITPLKHMQKDANLVMAMSEKFTQPMPVTSACTEMYKLARQKFGDSDLSAICKIFRCS